MNFPPVAVTRPEAGAGGGDPGCRVVHRSTPSTTAGSRPAASTPAPARSTTALHTAATPNPTQSDDLTAYRATAWRRVWPARANRVR